VRPHLEWVDPADIVNSVLERRKRQLAERSVVLDLARELPLIYVHSVLLAQALGQILDNAVKYSDASSTISISAANSGDSIRLSVGDEGAGLVGEERTWLFERFFRGQRHTASSTGSGLGLWIAHAFVGANQGHLEVESEGEGRGATISIVLPCSPLADAGLSDEFNE
jgi:two-component system sensor histidine kinase KdpD